MKATWIIFAVLVLGINTAFSQKKDSIEFNISGDDWCYSTKQNMYGATFCDERITESTIYVYHNNHQMPYNDGNSKYIVSYSKGMIYIGIRSKVKPGKESFNAVIFK